MVTRVRRTNGLIRSLRARAGFTLIEVVVAMMLLPIVLLAATTVYATAYNFFLKSRDASGRVETLMAAEAIVRKITQANKVVIDSGGQQIRIRWDYSSAFVANNTPSNFSDDTWVKYAVILNKLYWRMDAAGVNPDDPDPAVASSGSGNEEFSPALNVVSTQTFLLTNPSLAWDASNAGDATVVYIDLSTQTGNPAQTTQVKTQAAIGQAGKN